jgi:hypothetical protein
MAGMDVRDLVSNVPEEGHDLAGSDLAAYAHGGCSMQRHCSQHTVRLACVGHIQLESVRRWYVSGCPLSLFFCCGCRVR